MSKISWCGYDWDCKMEGGRIIHPSYPYAYYSDSKDVLKIDKNGEMSLYYRENPKEIKYWDGTTYYPTIERALIRTLKPFDYGTFSIEAVMPKGINLTCAFWLSGDGNWPPEIDICEAWSDDNNYYHTFTNKFPWLNPSWDTTTNVHYNNDKLEHKHLGSKSISIFDQKLDPSENWIKYECEWKPDKITFKANGKTVQTVSKKYAKMLTENLKNPEKGYLMDVIIDINLEDPSKYPTALYEPFKVRNFKYKQLS